MNKNLAAGLMLIAIFAISGIFSFITAYTKDMNMQAFLLLAFLSLFSLIGAGFLLLILVKK